MKKSESEKKWKVRARDMTENWVEPLLNQKWEQADKKSESENESEKIARDMTETWVEPLLNQKCFKLAKLRPELTPLELHLLMLLEFLWREEENLFGSRVGIS